MAHLIVAVDQDSVACRYEIAAGSILCAIDGKEVLDIIDYELFTAARVCTLTLIETDGTRRDVTIQKGEYESLGLTFESGLMSELRGCRNHCIFCFIDQMPKGIRKTLEVKDDDWRMSLIMGNYVTLTNVTEQEFERMIARRVSPLYISVHATDAAVRIRMMKNPNAGLLMDRLTRLREENLLFHAQVVLCPDVNDGAVLEKTIADLGALFPAARSLAIVPVGLTKHREGLTAIEPVTKERAQDVIRLVEEYQIRFLKEYGTRFVFAADEFYLAADLALPLEETFEDYAQLENGVGLLRKFESDFLYQLEMEQPLLNPATFDAVCGVSAYPFLKELFEKLIPYRVHLNLRPVRNDFFGDTVTVSGLVTGSDIISQFEPSAKILLIPSCMLRYQEDVFLDGTTLDTLKEALHVTVIPINGGDGADFISELFEVSRSRGETYGKTAGGRSGPPERGEIHTI